MSGFSESAGSYRQLVDALRFYADGLYEGDVDTMRRVFHPSCRLFSCQDGKLRELRMEDYYRTVTQRPSPASLHEPRVDRILSLSMTEAGAAAASMRTTRAPRIYTDFLTLLYLDDRWQIVSKTYSWTASPNQKP